MVSALVKVSRQRPLLVTLLVVCTSECFATRFGHAMFGKEGGSEGVDQSFAMKTDVGIGAEIMGAGKFGPPNWHADENFEG